MDKIMETFQSVKKQARSKPLTRPKGDKTRQRIVEAASRLLGDGKIEDFSYQQVADEVEVTRQLVRHHFPQKTDLLEAVVYRIMDQVKDECVHALEALHSDPNCKTTAYNLGERSLEALVATALQFVRQNQKEASIWVLFLKVCSQDEAYRHINQNLSEFILESIIEILKLGASKGEFAAGTYTNRARLMQTLLIGAAISLITELNLDERFSSQESFGTSELEELVLKQCLTIAKMP